jgi:predicted metallo-beta-lactamase superfamily hydrolase
MVFKVGGFEINFSTPSPPYGFFEMSIGTVVMFTVTQRSAIVRTSFSLAVQGAHISLDGLEYKNIDCAGNATVRSEATTISCFLMTT